MDKQAPVAHVYRIEANGRPCVAWDDASGIKVGAKLYVAPPKRDLTCICGAVWEGEQMVHAPRQRQWVGLTEPELHQINPTWPAPDQQWDYEDVLAFARAIEAKLKEKNT
jgi:acetone carboxylase gamma subunit